jgi:hypothetical protein
MSGSRLNLRLFGSPLRRSLCGETGSLTEKEEMCG